MRMHFSRSVTQQRAASSITLSINTLDYGREHTSVVTTLNLPVISVAT